MQILNVQPLILILLSVRYYSTSGLVDMDINWVTNNFTETINEQTKGRWNASKNNFISFLPEDLISLANVYGYHPNPRFTPYTKVNETVKKQDIPISFDARDRWPDCPSIGTIRNQGRCGASWAFAAAEVMSDRLCIASGGMMKFIFSVEELISCCDKCGDGCKGGFLYPPFEYWRSVGIPSGGTELNTELLFSSAANELSKLSKGDLIDIIVTKGVPFAINVSKTTKELIEKGNYKDKLLNQGCKPFTAMNGITPICKETCWSSYNVPLEKDRRHGVAAYHLDTDVLQIQAEIMEHGPVVAAMDLYKDFYAYSSGIYEHVSWDIVGHQAVKIIGWGVDNGLPYWLLANSWGTHFGEDGFVRIQRGVNQCGIEYRVTGGTPDITE